MFFVANYLGAAPLVHINNSVALQYFQSLVQDDRDLGRIVVRRVELLGSINR